MAKELEVKLPEYDQVPRWLIIQQEIDSRLFILEKIAEDEKRKSAITRMVDEATGFDEQLSSDAQTLMAELRWLKKEYDKEIS